MRLGFAALVAATLWHAWLLFELFQLSMPADFMFDESLNVAITMSCIVLLWFSPTACFTILTLMFVVIATDIWSYGLDLNNELDRNSAISFALLTGANLSVGYELWRKRKGRGKTYSVTRNMAGPLLRAAQICILGALSWDCIDIVHDILTRPESQSWTANIRPSPLIFVLVLLTAQRVPVAAITLSGFFASAFGVGLLLHPYGTPYEILRFGGYSILMGVACIALIFQFRRAKAVKDWGEDNLAVFD